MRVLGICDNHDTGAALIDGEKIICAVSEERFNREKYSREFPYTSIDHLFREYKSITKEIDMIAYASYLTPPFILRLFNKSYAKFIKEKNPDSFSYLLHLLIMYEVLVTKFVLPKKIETWFSGKLVKKRLQTPAKDFLKQGTIPTQYGKINLQMNHM